MATETVIGQLLAALQRMLDCHKAAMDAAQSSSYEVKDKPCPCGACDEARAAIERALGQEGQHVKCGVYFVDHPGVCDLPAGHAGDHCFVSPMLTNVEQR